MVVKETVKTYAKPEKNAHAISYMVVKESVKTRKGIRNTALPENCTRENQHNIMQQHESEEITHANTILKLTALVEGGYAEALEQQISSLAQL